MTLDLDNSNQVEGEIQSIRKDRKALAIEGVWYQSNFKLIPEEFKKGDFVKVTFNKKGEFNNVKSIEKVKQDIKEDLDILTSTDKNCILITAKDLYLDNKDIPLNEWIKEIKRLRENL